MKLGLGLGINYGGTNLIPAEARRFISAAGITDHTQKRAITYLVRQLKANNLYSKFSVLYPFVGGSAESHKINLINPADSDAAFRIVWSGSVTHNANGIKSNGTNGYGDTKYNPVAQSSSLTSLSIGIYKKGAEAGGTSRLYIGNSEGSNKFNRIGWVASGSKSGGLLGGSNPTTEITPLEANTQREGIISINVSGNRNAQYWANGEKIGTAVTQTASAHPNLNLFILCSNESTLPSFYSLESVQSFVYISTGLSDSEMIALHAIITAYQTLLGRN